MELLQNKHVLIVGATGGIGAEAARLIHKNKARLYLAGRDQTKLDELGSDLGVPAERIFRLDVTDDAAVRDVADRIHAQTEKLDILINAAGIGIIHPLEKLSEADFRKTIDTNLNGAFYLMKNFVPPMKKAKRGLVINIPGVLGKTPMAGAAAYAASKYGIDGMTKSIREELKRTQVRITNVYLGGVNSPFWEPIDLKVPHDRMITTKEAARSIWFLCQQPSSGVVSEMVIQPFYHQAI